MYQFKTYFGIRLLNFEKITTIRFSPKNFIFYSNNKYFSPEIYFTAFKCFFWCQIFILYYFDWLFILTNLYFFWFILLILHFPPKLTLVRYPLLVVYFSSGSAPGDVVLASFLSWLDHTGSEQLEFELTANA